MPTKSNRRAAAAPSRSARRTNRRATPRRAHRPVERRRRRLPSTRAFRAGLPALPAQLLVGVVAGRRRPLPPRLAPLVGGASGQGRLAVFPASCRCRRPKLLGGWS